MADISITAGSVVPSANATKVSGTAGAAISGGQTVYYDTTARTYKLADGNDTLLMPVVGIACNTAGTGQPITVCTADPDLAIGTHGLTIGTAYYQSATPGGICPVADVTTGNFVTALFIVKSATTVTFGVLGGGAAKA